MNNKNVILNCTLENYNKKYRNRRYRLIKYTKKEVEDFDKQYGHYIFNKKTYSLEFNNYLLKDRKWVLINGTYYEIPRPIRFTWFRNLNAGIQTITCLIGVGAVSSAVVVPTLMLTVWNKGDKPIGPEPVKEWYEDSSYINNLGTSDIGITKEVIVNGLPHKVRLIGIDHDDLATGNGKAHTTWEFANLISDKDGNSLAYLWNDTTSEKKDEANYDYRDSSIRYALTGSGNNNGNSTILAGVKGNKTWESDYKNKTILSMLPSTFINKLKRVSKPIGVYNVEGSKTYEEKSYDDKLFMLSAIEMGYTDPLSQDKGFGSTYTYYQNATTETNTKRIKKQVNGSTSICTTKYSITYGSGHLYSTTIRNHAGYNSKLDETGGGYYWLRSPSSSNGYVMWDCSSGGKLSIDGSSLIYALGVAPAFCL